MLFGNGPVLFHKSHPRQAELQICFELILWQIALEPPPLVTFRVNYQDGRRPNSVKTLEIGWILLDVDVEWNEVTFDIGRQTGVVIRLGFEPCAGTSTGSGAEIDQQRFVLIFGVLQCRIGVGDPID